MDTKERVELYQRAKPSLFIIAELAVLLARINAAQNALDNMPIITPDKYQAMMRDISHMLMEFHSLVASEQSSHEKRVDDIFGITPPESDIPF